MKVEGSIISGDPTEAAPYAREMEEVGFDGGFTFEGPHDPFMPLAIAAGATQRLELSTAVAIAFARNPMILANTGFDLQLASRGRFRLGLGSQIRPHIQRRFSSEWSRPAARMREFVQAIRAIWACWQHGEKLDFRGDFYTHTLMTAYFKPEPSPYGLPGIYLAGIGPRMTETAGEVADGFLVHPFHTTRFFEETTRPALERGRARGAMAGKDLEIVCQLITATGSTQEELERAKTEARGRISFYGSTPAYRPVLEAHGWGELQSELNRLSKQGRWMEMIGLIDDEMLETIGVVAESAQLGRRIRERCGPYADRVGLTVQTPGFWTDIVKDVNSE